MKTTIDIYELICRFCTDIPITECRKFCCCCTMDTIARIMVLEGEY